MTDVSVSLLLKNLVDSLSYKPSDLATVLVAPVALLFAYCALREIADVPGAQPLRLQGETGLATMCQTHRRAAAF